MIYLFKKFNGQVTAAAGAQAWEMFTSNGEWKFRPVFLGAVSDDAYKAIKAKVQEALPITADLITRVNAGENRQADRELKIIQDARIELSRKLIEELAATADKSQTPPNMDIVNKDSLPKEYHAMARNMTSHE